MRSPAQSGITLLAACGRKAKGKVQSSLYELRLTGKGNLDRINRINRMIKTCSGGPDGSLNVSIAFGKREQRLIL